MQMIRMTVQLTKEKQLLNLNGLFCSFHHRKFPYISCRLVIDYNFSINFSHFLLFEPETINVICDTFAAL
jgi:hypothetical protein